MRYSTLVQILFFASVAFASDSRASCELPKKSILSVSPPGLAQVSNVGDIQITCHIPARPFPTKPGETRNGLKAATTAYEIMADGTKRLVPSEVNVFGGGGDWSAPGPEAEWVDFDVHIPLDAEELDTEVNRFLAKVEQSPTPEEKSKLQGKDREQVLERTRKLVYQHRVGHFQVECQVLDGSLVMGSDIVELEVLFKGRFSDIGPSASPPA